MLVFDELKKNDPQLRLVAVVLVGGLFILLAGLWWVQVVSAREYQAHLDTQQYRTIRIPAVRGKILDREGRVLAENRPRYNLSLYLDDLRKTIRRRLCEPNLRAATNARAQVIAAREKKLGRSLTKAERKQFAFKPAQVQAFGVQARDTGRGQRGRAGRRRSWASRWRSTRRNSTGITTTQLAMPFPILKNLERRRRSRGSRKISPADWAWIWNCSPCAAIRSAHGGASARRTAAGRQFHRR